MGSVISVFNICSFFHSSLTPGDVTPIAANELKSQIHRLSLSILGNPRFTAEEKAALSLVDHKLHHNGSIQRSEFNKAFKVFCKVVSSQFDLQIPEGKQVDFFSSTYGMLEGLKSTSYISYASEEELQYIDGEKEVLKGLQQGGDPKNLCVLLCILSIWKRNLKKDYKYGLHCVQFP